jgi:hypothetical protein
VLIATVARLGYLGTPDDTVLDVTYGRGLWWTRYQPARLVAGLGDFRNRPEADGSVPVVCFDPPYISTGSRETSSVDDLYARYGLGELKGWRAIRSLIDDGLTECARILAPGGFLLVKCMNYVESGRRIWNVHHFATYGEHWGSGWSMSSSTSPAAALNQPSTSTARAESRGIPAKCIQTCWCSPNDHPAGTPPAQTHWHSLSLAQPGRTVRPAAGV